MYSRIKRHHDIFFFAFVIFILLLIGITRLALMEKKTLNSRAETTSSSAILDINNAPIIKVDLRYNALSTNRYVINKAVVTQGYLPPASRITSEYSIALVDSLSNIILKRSIPILTFEATVASDTTPVIQNFSMILPYIKNSAKLRILNKTGGIVNETTLAAALANFVGSASVGTTASSFGIQSASVVDTTAGDGYVDLVFISSNFGAAEMATFRDMVTRSTNALFATYPFNFRKSQFRVKIVDNVDNLGCYFFNSTLISGSSITCDYSLVSSKIYSLKIPYDVVAVIYKSNSQAGSAYMGGGFQVTTSWADGDISFLHELGHSFGELQDEYVYKDQSVVGQFDLNRNCYHGTPPNPSWSGIVKTTDYYLGCTSSTWWRSTPSSMMTSNSTDFNEVSRRYLNESITYYAGAMAMPTYTPTPTNTPIPPTSTVCSPSGISPINYNVVTTQTPTLSWKSCPNAVAYKVTLYGNNVNMPATKVIGTTYKVLGYTFLPSEPYASYTWIVVPCYTLACTETMPFSYNQFKYAVPPSPTPIICKGVQHCTNLSSTLFEYCGSCTGAGCRSGYTCASLGYFCRTYPNKVFNTDTLYQIPCTYLTPTRTPTPTLSATRTPTPIPKPDFTIYGAVTVAPTSTTVGKPINVKFTIKNQGNKSAAMTYTYTNQAGGMSSLESSNTCYGNIILAPGVTCVSSNNFTFSTIGSKTMTIKIDSSNVVVESNETNNVFSKIFTVNASPPTPTPLPVCTDSDNGNAPFVKGTVVHCPYGMGCTTYFDYCRTTTAQSEMICLAGGSKSITWNTCLKGCLNGVCTP